jgi:hypothetical protein
VKKLAKNKHKKNEYKEIRKIIVKQIRDAERLYLKNRIKKTWCNIKEQWKILNRVTGRISNKHDIIDRFLVQGRWIEDKQENANHFNDYYASVGPTTNKGIGKPKQTAESYLHNHGSVNPEKLLFSENVGEDVLKVYKNMRKKKERCLWLLTRHCADRHPYFGSNCSKSDEHIPSYWSMPPIW